MVTHRSTPLLEKETVTSPNDQEKFSFFDGSFIYICTALAALGPFSFGYTVGFTSPVLLAMSEDLNLTTAESSVFSAIVSLGAVAGAASAGTVADRWGRRAALLVGALFFCVGWTSVSVSQEIVLLCTGRVFTGMGTGLVSFAVPVYIAEIAPGSLRGSLGAVNQLAITIGLATVYALGLSFTWRPLALLGVAPATFLLLGLFVIPESPRWLASHECHTDVKTVLSKLRGREIDVSIEEEEIQAAVNDSRALPSASLADLCSPALRKPLVVSVGLMVLQQLSGVNVVMFFSGPIFKESGFTDPNLPGFVLQLIQVFATGIATGVMDMSGRRTLLMTSCGGAAAGLFLLGLSFQLSTPVSSWLAVGGLVLYIVFFSFGLGSIPWIIMSEVFPAHIRGVAGSVSVVVNWSLCFLVTLTFRYLLLWSNTGAFWCYSLECIVTITFVWLYVPETRGLTLEQIQALFTS